MQQKRREIFLMSESRNINFGLNSHRKKVLKNLKSAKTHKENGQNRLTNKDIIERSSTLRP